MVVTVQFWPKTILPFPLDQQDCCNKNITFLVHPLVTSHKQFQPEQLRNSSDTDRNHEGEVGKNALLHGRKQER